MAWDYCSTLIYHGKPVDCRVLTLSINFYQLSYEQMLSLSSESAMFMYELFGDRFYARWRIGRRNTRYGSTAILKKVAEEKVSDYLFESFLKGPQVFDPKSFRCLDTYLMRVGSCADPISPGVSIDFMDQWQKLFPDGRPNDREMEENIFKLCNMSGYKCTSYWYGYDLQAMFSSLPYKNFPESYHGGFSVNICGACLGDYLNKFAEKFRSFAAEVATKYGNINAHVMLQPSTGSPYQRYFRGYSGQDDSHIDANCLPVEWYPTYHIYGVEWANIISPLVQTHLDVPVLLSAAEPGVSIQLLSSGAILVGSKKDIDQYDVEDGVNLKRLLYPALYPGHRCISLKEIFPKDGSKPVIEWFPRYDWSIVPVFREEIYVVASHLVFSHLNDR